jgi:hypothetical protein
MRAGSTPPKETGHVSGIQFITDEKGRKTAVIIDLKKHKALWEDIEDVLVSQSRRHEKRIPLDKAKPDIFGVMSYSVAQRTHEIGIRVALGARRRAVLKLVLGQGLKLVAAGVALGLAASFALAGVLSGFLYDVRETDPVTLTGVTLLLLLVAVAASYLPARRAMAVDPAIALRHE